MIRAAKIASNIHVLLAITENPMRFKVERYAQLDTSVSMNPMPLIHPLVLTDSSKTSMDQRNYLLHLDSAK